MYIGGIDAKPVYPLAMGVQMKVTTLVTLLFIIMILS